MTLLLCTLILIYHSIYVYSQTFRYYIFSYLSGFIPTNITPFGDIFYTDCHHIYIPYISPTFWPWEAALKKCNCVNFSTFISVQCIGESISLAIHNTSSCVEYRLNVTQLSNVDDYLRVKKERKFSILYMDIV